MVQKDPIWSPLWKLPKPVRKSVSWTISTSKPRTGALKWVRKEVSFQRSVPPHASRAHDWDKKPTSQLLPWKGNRRTDHPVFQVWGGSPRDWLQSGLTQSTTMDAWGPLRTRESLWVVGKPENLQYLRPRQPPEKDLSNPGWGGGWMTHRKYRDDTAPQKVWDAPRNSSWADWWRSSPVQSQSIKTDRGGYFLKCKNHIKK